MHSLLAHMLADGQPISEAKVQHNWKAFGEKLANNVVSIGADGTLDPVHADHELEAILPKDPNSVGLVIEAKTAFYFAIVEKGLKEPPPGFEPQKIMMLPGAARIRVPPVAGEKLGIRVWLAAKMDYSAVAQKVSYDDQSEKIDIEYELNRPMLDIRMNAAGSWDPPEAEKVVLPLPKPEEKDLPLPQSSRAPAVNGGGETGLFKSPGIAQRSRQPASLSDLFKPNNRLAVANGA
jgi:hypothetical protein